MTSARKVGLYTLLMLCLPPLAAASDSWNVDSFGAVANDGRPDDHAVSMAMRKARQGDTLRFAAGTYHLRNAIHLKSGVTLAGEGAGKTVLRALPRNLLSQRQSIVNMDHAKQAVIRDLAMDGANRPDLPFGVLGGYGGGDNRLLNVHITNIAAQDAYGSGPVGVLLTDQPNDRVSGCRFSHIQGKGGQGAAIGLYGGPYAIDGNHVSYVGRNGIYALRCSGSIINNTIENSGTGTVSGDTGLSIELHPGDGEGGCKDVVVSNNRVDSWISVVGATRAAIRNNVIGHERSDKRYAGIETSGENILVSGNRIGSGVHTGIVIERPSFDIAVFDNDVEGTDTIGVAVIGARKQDPSNWLVENILLAGNRVAGVNAQPPNEETSTEAGSGLEINNNAVRITVFGNDFEHNDASAIALFDEKGDKGPDQLFFVNNRIDGNKKGPITTYGHSQMHDRRVVWKNNAGVTSNPLPQTRSMIWQPMSLKIVSDSGKISGQKSGVQNIGIGQVVRFSIDALPREATDVLWDFGEGRPVPGKTARRKFAKPGRYVVRAVVWLKSGQSALLKRTVTVR